VKRAGHLGTRNGTIWKTKLMSLELIIKTKTLGIFLIRRKNFFNHMLNVHGVHDVRQMNIHTAEPLVPEPRFVKVEIAI
jgi:hypothetical protein